MQNEPKQYYLLSPHEAELIACFRLMGESAQDVISAMCAAQSVHESRIIDTPVKLSLVSKS